MLNVNPYFASWPSKMPINNKSIFLLTSVYVYQQKPTITKEETDLWMPAITKEMVLWTDQELRTGDLLETPVSPGCPVKPGLENR